MLYFKKVCRKKAPLKRISYPPVRCLFYDIICRQTVLLKTVLPSGNPYSGSLTSCYSSLFLLFTATAVIAAPAAAAAATMIQMTV